VRTSESDRKGKAKKEAKRATVVRKSWVASEESKRIW